MVPPLTGLGVMGRHRFPMAYAMGYTSAAAPRLRSQRADTKLSVREAVCTPLITWLHQIDRLPFRVQRVDRDRPERGSRRHRSAFVHRVGQHRRRPPKLLRLSFYGGRASPIPAIVSQHVLFGHLRPRSRPTHRSKVDPGRFGYATSNGRRTNPVRPVACPTVSATAVSSGS